MQDMFVEQIVRRKLTKKTLILRGLLYAIAAVLMLLALMIQGFGIIIAVLIAVGSYYLHTTFNQEYEYVVTAGDMDIDCIVNKSRRKKMIAFKIKDIQIIAPAATSEHQQELNNYQRILDYSSGVLADSTYVMVVAADKEKVKIYFDPNEKVLASIKAIIPRRTYVD